MSTVTVQSGVLRVLRVVVIVALVVATVVPFLYMLSLSFVRIDDLLREPLRVLPALDRITTEHPGIEGVALDADEASRLEGAITVKHP